ncbi:3-methyl-2-oxobutanoate hydroxymethyltransferase [Helicobacter muridarum]|uniref:3-methyl-2-oxobutanoate hydroxymethyltransferase n=1 Tax=Helicobacter muridarum TaxID=216 RepID=A0A099TZB4_9HELI|nr:3-methyl-2-oxobutanoate hydroxymethyltransferase [Helicobacter muridarum]TLE01116.1 3-methyl-2-oxobutanoate hydroxymethyltransferase [Helicobacter muridarum]STQ85984.1 3-methyl-2-oxobutanoate hydroxymethyltransferase [Helicobacter muridarum]
MQQAKKITINDIKEKKAKSEKIVSITAYDALMSSIFDGEVDIILVGDSLKMSFGGDNETLGATMEEMLYHTKAVCNGVNISFVIADMPFGSYATKEIALKNALRFYKETRADAIKVEVGLDKIEIVKALCNEGIAVMAHIGLMPQYARFEGGFKIKGKDATQAEILIETAKQLQVAGAFGILCEGIKTDIAKRITESIDIPTIGIGAGKYCDGQILVWSDAFGFFDRFKPKFVKRYCNGKEMLQYAIREYADDIRLGRFPSEKESY